MTKKEAVEEAMLKARKEFGPRFMTENGLLLRFVFGAAYDQGLKKGKSAAMMSIRNRRGR